MSRAVGRVRSLLARRRRGGCVLVAAEARACSSTPLRATWGSTFDRFRREDALMPTPPFARVASLSGALVVLACASTPELATMARTDYAAAAAGEFFAAPFPDEGRAPGDVEDLPALRRPEILDTLAGILRESEGFGATSTIFVAFDGPLEPLALGARDTTTLDAPVFLLDLDLSPPTPRPIEVRYRDEATPFGAPHLLSLLPLQGVPLTPGHRHVAVVTTRVRDRAGRALGPSAAIRALRDGARPAGLDEAGAAAHQRALDALDALGVEPAAIAVFTPADATTPMRALRDAILAHAPTLDGPLELLETHDDFCVFASTLPMPSFQRGEPPFAAEGGDVVFEGGVPVLQRTEPARVFVTLPRAPMPTGGFPTLVFSRTGGGGDRPLIDRGVRDASGAPIEAGSGPARELAAIGFAGVSVDGPHGGARNVSGGDEQFLVFNVANPRALRDNVRQSAAELALLAHLVGTWTIDASACEGLEHGEARLDDARLALMGHSMGATIAPLAAAVEPRYRALVLSGAGGSWIQNVIHKEKPVVVRPLAELLLRTPRGYVLHEHDPALMLLQWAGEGADPPVFGPALRALGTHVLMMQGIVDHYLLPPIANAASLGFGLDLGGPALDEADARLVAYEPLAPLLPLVGAEARALPLGGNQAGVTRVVTQHAEDGVEDGHEVVFQTDAPKAEYRCFLATFARGEAPRVERDGCGE